MSNGSYIFECLSTLLSLYTICPRSSDPFYVVSYYIKWVTTSWTHSTYHIEIMRLLRQGFFWYTGTTRPPFLPYRSYRQLIYILLQGRFPDLSGYLPDLRGRFNELRGQLPPSYPTNQIDRQLNQLRYKFSCLSHGTYIRW